MITYFITLDRIKERSNYIEAHVNQLKLDACKISAVDGKTLTYDDIARECNIKRVESSRNWLTDGAIGCALSHKLAYKKFLETSEKAAFIIEDDAVLPENIKSILDAISNHIKSNEVILLYYTSFKPTRISKLNGVELSGLDLSLYYPVDVEQPITATAYCIGREAAEGVLKANTPIEVAADSWYYFFSKGAFTYFRLLYPAPIVTMNYKSSIDYFKKGSFKAWLSEIINKYKIPLLYQYVKNKRAENLKSMLNHFELVEEKSPIAKVE